MGVTNKGSLVEVLTIALGVFRALDYETLHNFTANVKDSFHMKWLVNERTD